MIIVDHSCHFARGLHHSWYPEAGLGPDCADADGARHSVTAPSEERGQNRHGFRRVSACTQVNLFEFFRMFDWGLRIVFWSVVSGFRLTGNALRAGSWTMSVHAHTDSAAVADLECHHANRCLESTARIQVFSWIFTLAGEWCVGSLSFHFPPHLLSNIR